jgi:hypothetical protein
MLRGLIAFLSVVVLTAASAQPTEPPAGGNLYVAGNGFDFASTAERAAAQNPNTRFFLLVIGDAVRYLSLTAPPELVEVRNRVARTKVQFLVCQRTLDEGTWKLTDFVPGTVAVRGWPPPGSAALPQGSNYYRGEDPATLPWSTETLRRLRSTCSS